MIPKIDYEKYEKLVTVAGVNFRGVWGDKAANLERIKNQVQEAARLGINIIAFPELALSRYECGEEVHKHRKSCSMHTEVAETIPGPATEEIARLTKELGIYVIFGMPEKDAKDSDRLYISAAVIGPEGLIGKYRKLHLAGPPRFTESICFKPGSDLPTFETKYGPIGVLICYDFWVVPELSRLLFLKGARIIFNTSGSPVGPGKTQYMTQQVGCRASESFIYTVGCNHVGKDRTISYYGYSTIAGPVFPRMNMILAQGGEDEEIVHATINFETLRRWREVFVNLKSDVNWQLIVDEYQKVVRGS